MLDFKRRAAVAVFELIEDYRLLAEIAACADEVSLIICSGVPDLGKLRTSLVELNRSLEDRKKYLEAKIA